MKSFIAFASAVLVCSCANIQDTSEIKLVIGTYGENLYTYSLDNQKLEFTLHSKAAAMNPSYALADGEGGIYAVSEVGNASGVYSFRQGNIMASQKTEKGQVTDGREGRKDQNTEKVNDGREEQKDQRGNECRKDQVEMTADLRQTGADPCFIMLYEGYMMTADYSGGSISVFPVGNGKIGDRCAQLKFEGCGPVKARQEASHIHQLKEIPSAEGYILATDLGADVIRLIKVSEENGISLTHIKDIPCPAGSGPRHMEFDKEGKRLYCIAELSGQVLVYDVSGEDGEVPGEPQLNLIQQIQADEVNAGGSADIHMHPSEKWLYTSHRLDNDGISIFVIKEDGTLEKTGYARTARHPRNFTITPDGNLLLVACRDDKVIQIFSIEEDGSLTLMPKVLLFESDMPSSITVM